MTMLAENPRAVIGGNSPPLSPYEQAEKRILDLYQECSHWLDGDEVDSEETAEGIGSLLNLLRAAVKEADDARIEENKPFDDGKKSVQERYNELIADTKTKKGKAVIAMEACKKALAPWLAKKAAAIAETARLAREEADRVTARALEAMRSSTPTNLAERAAAEELVTEAKAAEKIATKAENTTAKVSNMAGRAIGLRTVYTATVTDPHEFSRYVWFHHTADITAFLSGLADRLVADGKRELPGVDIKDKQVAQ